MVLWELDGLVQQDSIKFSDWFEKHHTYSRVGTFSTDFSFA